MSTSQGDFRSRYAGGQISLINFSTAGSAGLAALKQKLVGKALDEAIRRETACTGLIAVEHEVLPSAENRLTLSDKKDMLGLNKPAVYYDVGDYVRNGANLHTFPITQKFAEALGAEKVIRLPGFEASQHIMGGTIMGKKCEYLRRRHRLPRTRSSQPVPAGWFGDAFGWFRQQHADDGRAGGESGRCYRQSDDEGVSVEYV
jgi:hypothetical protein